MQPYHSEWHLSLLKLLLLSDASLHPVLGQLAQLLSSSPSSAESCCACVASKMAQVAALNKVEII